MPVEENKNIIDLELKGTEKTQIRINGNNNAIIELDLSDLGIAERLESGYKKLQKIIQEITDYEGDSVASFLKEQDVKMRDTIDYIFDSKVSEVCYPTGTLFDLIDGEYKFERILNSLTQFYENNVNKEYKLMKKRIESKVDKYIPQDHKQKAKPQKKKLETQKDGDE